MSLQRRNDFRSVGKIRPRRGASEEKTIWPGINALLIRGTGAKVRRAKGDYMKLSGILVVVLSTVSLQTASAQTLTNPLWLYRDSIPADSQLYNQIGLCDTSATNTGCFNPVDTGNTYNGEYINFDYQFTDGYAGFNIFWDRGIITWNATKYDSMCLVHKGPLPGHTVKIFWAYTDRVYIAWQLLGQFKSSSAWKKETLPFPADFNKVGLFKLRMLIYNDSGITSPSSIPGNLKIDDIAFIKGPIRPERPAMPKPSSPENFSTITATSGILLSWESSDSATSYEVQVLRYSDTSGFSTVLDSTLTQTQLKTAPYPTDETGLFNWRVRAKNSADSSDWSEFWSFTVDHTSSTLVSRGQNFLKLSAVQKAGSAMITVALPSTCIAGTMTIVSISGKKLAERTISGPGLHTISIENVPLGVHFLRLNAGGNVIMRKLLPF